ncbi:hypothetical protein GWK47_053507 [Chionoecetes opilio]|uniref:Uncharacterized protein n=1 Tax=Chionoecetes opilio TaxID=41210 RepID=A0A8J4YAP4_CHIOP|nr:hypothetical protein GWK47_053507 [Chionoecetes opilio]
MMAAGQPKQASSEFLLNPNASTGGAHASGLKPWCRNRRPMILSLTPASSTSFKTTAATFLPVESELAGTPRRNSASFPREEDGDAVPRIAREGREEFSVQAGPTLRYPGSAFHDLLGGLVSPRNSCSMDRALRDRHTLISIPRT